VVRCVLLVIGRLTENSGLDSQPYVSVNSICDDRKKCCPPCSRMMQKVGQLEGFTNSVLPGARRRRSFQHWSMVGKIRILRWDEKAGLQRDAIRSQ
jgi:hypothetical protein